MLTIFWEYVLIFHDVRDEIQERLITLNQAALDHWGYDFHLPWLTWDLRGKVMVKHFESKHDSQTKRLLKSSDTYIKQNWPRIPHLVSYKSLKHRSRTKLGKGDAFFWFTSWSLSWLWFDSAEWSKSNIFMLATSAEKNLTLPSNHNKMTETTHYRHSTDGGKLVYIAKDIYERTHITKIFARPGGVR